MADYYSAFGGDLASGHYIALHYSVPGVNGVTITVQVTGRSAVTLDPDGLAVSHIADKDSQTITVVASKEGYDDYEMELDLSGLTLAANL